MKPPSLSRKTPKSGESEKKADKKQDKGAGKSTSKPASSKARPRWLPFLLIGIVITAFLALNLSDSNSKPRNNITTLLPCDNSNMPPLASNMRM